MSDESYAIPVSQMAENLRTAYSEVRGRHIVRNELESRGLNLSTYYDTQQRLVPAIVQMIDEQLRTWSPEVDFIVAGKDNSGCHIYTIQNPGDVLGHDSVGFAAIGSGGPHALYSLIESNYKKTMSKDEVMESVRKAKKRSEVAPGVGIKTADMLIE